MKQRIQKLLANAGVASRRNIEEMIRQGRIAVNGKVMTELPVLVDPEKDRLRIDDEPINLVNQRTGPRMYFLLNKPKDVYSTNVAQGEQLRAIDLLPPNLPGRIYPVGRLDAESKGLLLLTNDGDLTNQLTHPRFGVPKTYRALVDGYVEGSTIQSLEKGIWIADPHTGGFKTGRSHLKIVRRSREMTTLEITIRENRNRQIRQMLARAGHKVRDLTRTKIGPLTLDGLPIGAVRTLTTREVRELRNLCKSEQPSEEKPPEGTQPHPPPKSKPDRRPHKDPPFHPPMPRRRRNEAGGRSRS
ncbi:MAG: pseudouridine synthase [Planctomycetota bacterium]|nr:pseudouridine synthase [Planctomycetota bacterium]